MQELIQKHKYVELIYQTVDKETGNVYTGIEYPIGYVHGASDALSPEIMAELDGREVGDIIEVPIDCDLLYGPRDESLVFTDHIENVPEEYREIGTTITMENEKGEPKNFIVTKIDDENKTLTVDGNNPLCGRDVIFKLEIMMVRDASDEEIAIGGKVGADPSLDEILENGKD
ncbi:MAG TPA: peptidylprolyl isomerase [Leucothrix mucor]|nr:peptidylprolyl isomerase [Leucothrix mucor]